MLNDNNHAFSWKPPIAHSALNFCVETPVGDFCSYSTFIGPDDISESGVRSRGWWGVSGGREGDIISIIPLWLYQIPVVTFCLYFTFIGPDDVGGSGVRSTGWWRGRGGGDISIMLQRSFVSNAVVLSFFRRFCAHCNGAALILVHIMFCVLPTFCVAVWQYFHRLRTSGLTVLRTVSVVVGTFFIYCMHKTF